MNEQDQRRLVHARNIVERDRLEQEDVQQQYEDAQRTAALEARFAKATSAKILDMYERGVNEKGVPLSQFEFEALCEAWCGAFGDLPPSIAHEYIPSPEEEPGKPQEIEATSDDTMVSPTDVVRMTGLSLSTLKRKRAAGELPKPLQISVRRIGWPMRDLRPFMEKMQKDRGNRH